MSLRAKLAATAFATVGIGAAGVATGAAVAAAATLSAAWWWRRRSRFDPRGRVVLVTGGSRGLGFAIAREFVGRGARVALVARDPAELERAAERLRGLGPRRGEAAVQVHTVAADLARSGGPEAAVAAVTRHWGPVEILVHNAGVIQLGPWSAMRDEDFRLAMDVHFWAALHLARAVLPAMTARGQGRILNISSIGGVVPVPHMLPYTSSKFALVGFSQALGAEVRQTGVRVTCVCPFMTRTGSQEHAQVHGDHEREFAWFAAAGVVPVATQSAARAGRAAVKACLRGDSLTVLAWTGKLASLAHGVLPGTVNSFIALAARFLPSAPAPSASAAGAGADAATPGSAPSAEPRSGAESYSPGTLRLLKPRIQRDGRDVNQR